MERRPKRYIYDVDFGEIGDKVFTIGIMVFLIAVLIYIGWLLALDDEYDAYPDRVETVAKFNALSLEDRQLVLEWTTWGSNPRLDEETLTLSTPEVTNPKEVWFFGLSITLLICSCIMSVVIFICYAIAKDRNYFLADLPFGRLYGWWLFFSMFIAWPILLISAIRMWRYFGPAHKAERAEVTKQAKKELSDEQAYALAQSPEIRNQKTVRKAYIEYRINGSRLAQQRMIEAAEDKIKDLSAAIKEYGVQIQQSQRKLGETKAELNNLVSVQSLTQVTRDQAKAEWQSLVEMRGVAKITTHASRGNKPDKIQILVKVRVPYHNNIYDFGDYQITLNGTKYSCTRVRSGIRADHTSTRPNYNESSGFCFGSRKYTIIDYLEEGRTIEAITLMVDCLHSVNEGDEDYIPDCFRKVRTVERAKRRLSRQAKNKGGK